MRTLLLLLVIIGCAGQAWGASVGNAVEVRIRTDSGAELPFYPAAGRGKGIRVYAEARRGERYGIIVRNHLNRRVGVVIAVDGRNIISGKKSWLRSDERMYILDPYGEGEFTGWRTGTDRVNRFYFTTAADSYAAAFNDESAMGVIAVAVYPEVEQISPPLGMSGGRPRYPAKATSARYKALDSAREESAGTGYGREEYSPVRIVSFEPESAAREKIFIRYEWHATLCRKGIISCGGGDEAPNRLWDDGGFAPPPPGRQ